MTLFEQINNDIKTAMKEKRAFELDVLRMLLAALKNKRIEIFGAEAKDLSDEEVVAVIKTEVKKRKDSIGLYRAGGREDLAEKERQEIGILGKYMPKQMSEEEIEKVAREIKETQGVDSMQDFGRLMGQVMGKLKNQADGNTVSAIVKKVLSTK